uniref:Uncharacterized protein n=1 Tax=Vespula pensylvanica TaxID=30213 RepID=A0A834MXU4_VESPE|nr:hypothetical protein H0235_018416 [Vespula pensylvanica]
MSTATRCGLTQKGDPTAGKGKGEILKVAAVPVVAVALAVAAVAVAVAGDAGDADDADATAMWLLLTKRKLMPHKIYLLTMKRLDETNSMLGYKCKESLVFFLVAMVTKYL